MRSKNNCFDDKMELMAKSHLYHSVHDSFADSFAALQASRVRPSLLEEKIDDAIFFSADSSKCMLIVLERNDNKQGTFGTAWMFRGTQSDDTWTFEESMSTYFGHDYFNLYSENTFENISRLARHSVLLTGDVDLSGCEIDEHFWFVYLEE